MGSAKKRRLLVDTSRPGKYAGWTIVSEVNCEQEDGSIVHLTRIRYETWSVRAQQRARELRKEPDVERVELSEER